MYINKRMADTLVISLGTQCNNRCRYCLNMSGKGSYTEFNILKTRINQAIPLLEETNHVIVTGGEPTLHRNIAQIISLLRDFSFSRVEIQSNARILSLEGFAFKLVNAGLTHLFASFSGFPSSTHTLITGDPRAYTETVKGLYLATKCGLNVEVNFIVSKETLRDTLKFSSWIIKHLNSVIVRLSLCCYKGRAILNNSVPLLTEAVPIVLEAVKRLGKAGIEVTTQYVPLCTLDNLYYNAIEAQGPTKEVVLCDMRKERAFIWKGGKRQYHSKCRLCIAKKICPGVAHRKYTKDSDYNLFKPFLETIH